MLRLHGGRNRAETAAQGKQSMSKTTLICGKCDEEWICERHPDLPWLHDSALDPQCRAMSKAVPTESSRVLRNEPAWAAYAAVSQSRPSRTKAPERSSSTVLAVATAGQQITRR
jgi:hypothetical protein